MTMGIKILTVGGGAREHAAVEALWRSGAEIYAVMKNTNPGIEARSKKVLNTDEDDVDSICDFALNNFVEYAFVGPEAPLGAGVVDALENMGIKCASPTKAAARIETSKTFMRNLVEKYGIDGNLRYASFDSEEEAVEFVKKVDYPVAIKPVGLTGGKGVKVQGDQLANLDETVAYIREIFENNVGGGKVIIEEKAEGDCCCSDEEKAEGDCCCSEAKSEDGDITVEVTEEKGCCQGEEKPEGDCCKE